MNRRDMAKVVAAAAAGSVVGKAIDRDVEVAAAFICDPPDAFCDAMELARRKQGERIQQAIELGDRTAEELGDWSFGLSRTVRTKVWCATLIKDQVDEAIWIWSESDPDPLTAVQKAREAALSWREAHKDCDTASTLRGVEVHADDSLFGRAER